MNTPIQDKKISVDTDKEHSFKYKNRHGVEVEVPEKIAVQIHGQMEFKGCSDGSKRFPEGITGKDQTIVYQGREMLKKDFERIKGK